MAEVDHLARIVARKRLEVQRRGRFASFYARWAESASAPVAQPEQRLRRSGEAVRVIAEIKTRSPSAGEIRPRRPGDLVRVARSYEQHGAAAVSVLCDGPGFGGSPLDLRRVARTVTCPVLFKEFVVEPLQLDLARAVGASLVLLLVRVLDDAQLAALVEQTTARGMQPVVEAADASELERALRLDAAIVGVNARNLRTFEVDPEEAARLVDRIPEERVAVFMSGVRSARDMQRVRSTRADAVLVGEGLMRAPDPGARLRELLDGA